jgi:hypothetical protein
MAMSEARRALLEARRLYGRDTTCETVIAWDDEPQDEVEARIREVEARADLVVIVTKCSALPGESAPLAWRGTSLDAGFTEPPQEPAQDAQIAPPLNAEQPARHSAPEALGASPEPSSAALEPAPEAESAAAPATVWHVCEFSTLSGKCTVVPGCPRQSPLWEERERLEREAEEASQAAPDVIQLGGSGIKDASAGPRLGMFVEGT